MSASPLSPDDIQATAEVHAQLGPEYRDAVVESFLAKIDHEIGVRIDARLAATPSAQPYEPDPVKSAARRGLATGLVLGTAVAGIPLTVLAVNMGDESSGGVPVGWQSKVLLIWVVIAVLYGAGAAVVLALSARRELSAVRRHGKSDAHDSPSGKRARRVIAGSS